MAHQQQYFIPQLFQETVCLLQQGAIRRNMWLLYEFSNSKYIFTSTLDCQCYWDKDLEVFGPFSSIDFAPISKNSFKKEAKIFLAYKGDLEKNR